MNSKGFNELTKYILKNCKNQFCYETIIGYNNRPIDRIKLCKGAEKQPRKTFRNLLRDNAPILPLEFQKYVIPKENFTYISKNKTRCEKFEDEIKTERITEIVPFVLESGNIIMVPCTWKNSMEKEMCKDEFGTKILENVIHTYKSFAPSFGQTRACIYNINDEDIRLSIGKGFNFGGTHEGRRPII